MVANSIRTPRQGTNARSRRIAQAVDNEDWQAFRVSLKGTSTRDKLDSLQAYWYDWEHDRHTEGHRLMRVDIKDCDVCIRVDNYIKALCRGGQLEPFLNVSYFVNVGKKSWKDVLATVYIEGLRRQVSVIRK